VLSSRVDPPLPLVRFRARDQLAELRMADLRFTLEETAAFLAAITAVRWRPEALRELHDRTEGWITGLQIAGLELQRLLTATGAGGEISRFIAGFSGHHVDIRDFLEQEVLSCQSQQVQAFLMLTSVLDRLSGSLCDAVTGQKAGQALLERLEKANLFLTPLDGTRAWYRHHAMVADVLRDRLRQAPPDLVALLHRRAAEWYAAHGYVAEAADHQRRAEQFAPIDELDDLYRAPTARIGTSAPRLEDRGPIATQAPRDGAADLACPLAAEEPARAPELWIPQDKLSGGWWDQEAPIVAWWPAGAPLLERLTERELTILGLIAEGLTYTQVSRRLVIGLNTVRFHVKNIYGKLNVHSRAQAIARAKDLRLLPK
jgi:ATP/maltotriose-dependent transcriptional regulator MalT